MPIGSFVDIDRRGDDSNTFKHNQTTASATWTINHNLGKFPSVTVVDSANNVVEGCVQYIDNNTIELNFGSAFSGCAYLN
jgi:hypothetical protein